MNKGNNFGIQAKSSNDLMRQYKVKLENAKSSKESTKSLAAGKLDHWKQSLATGNAILIRERPTQIQHKEKNQRKQTLNNIAAVQPILEPSKKIDEQNNNLKRQLRSTMAPQVQGSMEEQASKKTNEQNKGFCQNNNHKRHLRSTMGNQVQGSMIEQVSNKVDERNKGFCQNNNVKRQPRCVMENQVQASVEEQQASKKKKTIPKCPAMPLDEYINKNKEQHGVEESKDENREENDMEQEVDGDINYESEEIEGTNENRDEGAALKRKRGKTLCKEIHARELKDRQEITLNEEGQPIGPDEKTVSEFSSFLGTIARSSDLCPLTYTSWKALNKSWKALKKEPIWDYVNQKYIIAEKGKKAVYATVNDAWRRYKCFIKKEHFSKYKNLQERLKNRPQEIPEADFRVLVEYWRLETTQEISNQNAQNIAQLKWRHRAGPISFARIREKLHASNEDKVPPTQAEVFIATRQSKKGKELDQETNNAIIKLHDLIENSGQSSSEAFQSVCGKEKPGRVRCHGRTTTPTLLKRNEEILNIKKEHADEVNQFIAKIQEIEEKREREKAEAEEKRRQEIAAMEQKFQILVKSLLNQNNSGLNMEALAALFNPADANSALRSSTSTHVPSINEMNNGGIVGDGKHLDTEDEDIDLDN